MIFVSRATRTGICEGFCPCALFFGQEGLLVQSNRSPKPVEPGAAGPRRDDLQSLLGSRWVQGLLVATAALSVVGAVARPGQPGQLARAAQATPVIPDGGVVAPLLPLAPSVAQTVEEAWRKRAVERESQQLAAKWAQRGYSVAPQLAFQIHDAALRHDIDPEIAFGLVRAESSFRNSATSHVGATGLTQLMPRTATWIAPGTTRADLRDPKKNLDIGFRYLRYLLDKYDGDIRLALLAYNRGPGTVDRVLRRGGNPDNGYVEMVLGTRTGKRR
jgi:soluble lytic murein transglycosylase-like protein